jgi:hypothetical protein
VRSVGDNETPETWPFLWNLSQRENPRVVSGEGMREEVCTLYRWGTGHTVLAPEKDAVFGWHDLVVGMLEGLVSRKGIQYTYFLLLRV